MPNMSSNSHASRVLCLCPRSRGSTLRSRTRPLGRSDSQAVRDGNVLAARAFILCLICAAKFIWWMLEQPGSSCMELHPLFQHMLKMLTIHKLGINMSDFGAPTTKRTLLYSSLLNESSFTILSNYPFKLKNQQSKMIKVIYHMSGISLPAFTKVTARWKICSSTRWNLNWRIVRWWFPTRTTKGNGESMVDGIWKEAKPTQNSFQAICCGVCIPLWYFHILYDCCDNQVHQVWVTSN